jgi:hypothetical protein
MGRIAGKVAVSSKVKLLVVRCGSYEEFAKKVHPTLTEVEKVKLWNRRSEFRRFAESLKNAKPADAKKKTVTVKAIPKKKDNGNGKKPVKNGKDITDIEVQGVSRMDQSLKAALDVDKSFKEIIQLLKKQTILMEEYLENDRVRMDLTNALKITCQQNKKK